MRVEAVYRDKCPFGSAQDKWAPMGLRRADQFVIEGREGYGTRPEPASCMFTHWWANLPEVSERIESAL
jgi:hypothetical protein